MSHTHTLWLTQGHSSSIIKMNINSFSQPWVEESEEKETGKENFCPLNITLGSPSSVTITCNTVGLCAA